MLGILWSGTLLVGSQPGPLAAGSYFLLVTLLSIALYLWLRAEPFVGVALLFSGLAIFHLTPATLAPSEGAPLAIVIAWNSLALLLFYLAALLPTDRTGERWQLTLGALGWSGIAVLYACYWHLWMALAHDLLATTLFGSALLIGLQARRVRLAPLLWPSLALGHWGLLHLFTLFASGTPSYVIPMLVWLALAALWLVAERVPRLAWASTVWRGAFIAEAIWILSFSTLDLDAATVAALPLTMGWLLRLTGERVERGLRWSSCTAFTRSSCWV